MKNSTVKLLLVLSCFISFSFSQDYDETISGLIGKVNADSLKKYVSELSGEVPVVVNGNPYTIKTRNAYSSGNEIAASYIFDKLKSFGVETAFDNYTPSGKNVIATQYGTKNPEKIYIICAHYDSMLSFGENTGVNDRSPGADDNASGTAAVIEIARILSKKELDHTVIYALWDEEEIGLIGSQNYASLQKMNGVEISGVLNLDMISYDSNDDYKTLIASDSQSDWITDQLNNINTNYELGLTFEYNSTGTVWYSDHSSFWDKDYPAVLLIESNSDFNRYYHTSYDLLKNINLTYFTKVAKLSMGLIAYWGGNNSLTSIEDEIDIVENYNLDQNYPNPFNPNTKITFSIPESGMVTLKVYDMLGREIKTLADNEFSAGQHTLTFDASNLTSGMYVYRISANGWSSSKKMLLVK